MIPKFFPIFVIIVIASNVKYNDAIKCYACGTLPTANMNLNQFRDYMSCAEPFDKNKAIPTECNGFCRKTHYKSGERHIIARGCSPLCYPSEATDMKTSCCNTDLCNGTPKMNGSLIMLTVSFILTIFATFIKENIL
ncbi:unnamed protein product [Gordionus sp. m RMFG-2023]|uniref:uncharacterized protein LOC135923447 n=1 Tax=Gordionus sp. m RMFG-2023 TaxID=3053472 RepID=UPI0030E0B5FF